MNTRGHTRRRLFHRDQTFGRWVLEEQIGQGGSGEVWRARHDIIGIGAIKLLVFSDKKAFARFKLEVEALERLRNVRGVLPILDKFIPKKFSDGTPWIAMPIAGRIFDHLKIDDRIKNVEYFIELAHTISEIHSLGIAHRDIKPENILFLNNRLQLSDFGLVKFSGRPAITRERENVGPKFTMAPEMRRSAYRADGQMADVFSFAKTLWVILSGQKLGFDGQYSPSGMLSLKNFMPVNYTSSLDKLLQECTDNEPARRPTMLEVARRLNDWVVLSNDFHKRNLIEWVELEAAIFPAGRPKQAVWTDVDAICSVINAISSVHSLIHMFYPTRGGNDITGAARAAEPGFIALHVQGRPRDILKPKKLTFESFGCDPQWNYFRLEAEQVPSTGQRDGGLWPGSIEWLTEYEDKIYIPREHWENDDYYGEPLPPHARPVVRYLRGSFVFFGKRSHFNCNMNSYDALHNEYGEDGFRKLISDLALKTHKMAHEDIATVDV